MRQRTDRRRFSGGRHRLCRRLVCLRPYRAHHGLCSRQAKARLIRDGVVIWEGDISSLKRFKDDTNEVKQGYECGISLVNFNDIKVDDEIEAFTIEKIAATEL